MITEADIVSDILRRARELMPEMPTDRWVQLETQLRAEYAGDKVYVSKKPLFLNEQIRSALLAGGNPTRVAAQFGVSVRTVYGHQASLRSLRRR